MVAGTATWGILRAIPILLHAGRRPGSGRREPSVSCIMTEAATRDAMIALALSHAALEAADDPGPVLATLEEDCVYELQPVGLLLTGIELARRYYDHFFTTFRPVVADFALRSEWQEQAAVGQEYTIWTRTAPDSGLERHEVIGILTFGRTKLSGERVYGSERLLRLMFGPVYAEGRAIGVGAPGTR